IEGSPAIDVTWLLNDGVSLSYIQLPGRAISEFSPYLQTLGALQDGMNWTSVPYLNAPQESWSAWKFKGKVVSHERVTVPAGSFDAIKVLLEGERHVAGSENAIRLAAAKIEHFVWYASDVKRVVKHARNTYSARGKSLDKEIIELLEYRLN
ncbi:MAG: hypothetical protein ACREUA_06305, partial [Burkholderiales bacterium]